MIVEGIQKVRPGLAVKAEAEAHLRRNTGTGSADPGAARGGTAGTARVEAQERKLGEPWLNSSSDARSSRS